MKGLFPYDQCASRSSCQLRGARRWALGSHEPKRRCWIRIFFLILFDLAKPIFAGGTLIVRGMSAAISVAFAFCKGSFRVARSSLRNTQSVTKAARAKVESGSWMAPINDTLLRLMSEKMYRESYLPTLEDYLAGKAASFEERRTTTAIFSVPELRRTEWIAEAYIARSVEAAKELVSRR